MLGGIHRCMQRPAYPVPFWVHRPPLLFYSSVSAGLCAGPLPAGVCVGGGLAWAPDVTSGPELRRAAGGIAPTPPALLARGPTCASPANRHGKLWDPAGPAYGACGSPGGG